MIVTKPRTAQEKKRLLAGEAAANNGLSIQRGIRAVIELYQPSVVATEAPGGSKSASGASAIARSHQATIDAVDVCLNALPIFVTPDAVKKKATGSGTASKDDIEAAMRARWAGSDFDLLLAARPPYMEQGQKLPPKGKWENAFDAAAVAHCAWDHPTVAMLRKLAA